MKLNDKFTVKAAITDSAKWAVEDGSVTVGKEYTVARVEQAVPSNHVWFRDNEGVLVNVKNFVVE